jgi:CO dehydrogenase maturation factor
MLLIVSDVSMRGMVTAARVKELIGEIRTSVGRVALVINRLDGDLTPEMEKAVAESGLELISTIPTDPQAAELDSRGLPLVRLPDDSPLMRAVRDISEKLGLL